MSRSRRSSPTSQGDIQTFQETKLRPMLELTRRPQDGEAAGRKAVNSRMISYIGGWLMFWLSGSLKTARGRSAPVIHQDDACCDPLPEGGLGELPGPAGGIFGDSAAYRVQQLDQARAGSPSPRRGISCRYYVPCSHQATPGVEGKRHLVQGAPRSISMMRKISARSTCRKPWRLRRVRD